MSMSLLNDVQKFIEAHPGCTSGDIADAFAGYSRQRVLQSASKLRQSGRVAHRCEGDTRRHFPRLVDIVSAFLALPPPVAEGEMDAHERKAWYQSERERLKFEQETAQLIPASDVRREFAIWAKAVVQVLETLPDILERDCGLQPAAVSRVQSIIDDLRDQIALRVTEAGADDEEELQQEE